MVKQKKQSFMQGIMTLMFSQVVIKIFGLIYKLYLTNKSGFGDAGNAIYSSGFQIYALLLTISSIGVPNAVAKLISEKLSIGDTRGAKKTFKVAFATFSIIGFCGSLFLFFGANMIANKWLQIPEAELTLTILAPSIFLESIIAVLRGYFNGYENMKPMAKSQTIEQLSKTVFTVIIVELICLFIGSQETTAIMAAGANLATTIATFIGFLYLAILYLKTSKINNKSIKKVYYKGERKLDILKKILIIAMPMTLSALLGSLNRNIDSVTIVRGLKTFMSEEQAKVQYGILSGKIETLVTFPLSFNIAFATALIPAISAAKAIGDTKSIEKRISFSILVTILIGLPCSVGMMIFAKPILQMLFPHASSGEFIYQICSISIIFITIEQTVTGALQGLGKFYVPILSLLVGVILKLITNLILVRINPENFVLGGVAGAAIGTVICHAVSMAINMIALKKYTRIKLNISKFAIKPIIATSIMGVSSFYIYRVLNSIINQNIAIILAILFAIVIYIITIFFIKMFNEEELYMLPFGKKLHELSKSNLKNLQRKGFHKKSTKKRRILSKIGE